jgi:hypothetical protein
MKSTSHQRAIALLEALGQIMTSPNFTDRGGYGPRCLEAAKALQDSISVPIDLWAEILDLLDDYSDVRDGADGPRPNDAMSLRSRITEAGLD